MTQSKDNSDSAQPEDSNQDPANIQDLVGGLDFVPQWAKSDAAKSGEKIHRDFEKKRGPARGRGRDGRKPRRDGGGGGNRGFSQKRNANDQRGGNGRGRDSNRPDRKGGRFQRREPIPKLPVDVSFIPERDRLGAVVKSLHSIKRSFPLPYLASLFLVKPEHHLIKIESRANEKGEPIQFFQCKKSRAVFLSQEELLDYVVRTHLEKHFERVEVEVEPPAGNFVCVGRCRRSGTLLGPPNYHGYNERVAEVHRSRFSHMPLTEYRNNIEMVRDPDVIEKWKEECKTKCLYRSVEEPESEATLTLAQVEKIFVEKHAPQYMQSGNRAIFPATLAGDIPSAPLLATINSARIREDRFPLSLMLALRPAFRRMRLHLIKAGKNETYITPAMPKPLDAEHAIPTIKKTVEIITAHPGCTKKILMKELFADNSATDEQVAEVLDSLVWLIDKGHIIEFFNGTFAIPGHLRDPGVVPKEMPQAHHHEETRKPAKQPSKPVEKVEAVKEQKTEEPSVTAPESEEPSKPVETEVVEAEAGAPAETSDDADQVETV